MFSYDDYIKALKGEAKKRAINLALAFIFEKAAFLAWGPLGYLTRLAVGKVVEYVINDAEIGVFFLYIDLRTSRQGNKFYDAVTANQRAQENGTEEEKKIAEENLKNAFRDLVKLTN